MPLGSRSLFGRGHGHSDSFTGINGSVTQNVEPTPGVGRHGDRAVHRLEQLLYDPEADAEAARHAWPA